MLGSIVLSVLLVFSVPVTSQEELPPPTQPTLSLTWSENNTSSYPNPQTNPESCLRCLHKCPKKSWICDPNSVLKSEVTKINTELEKLQNLDVNCLCNNVSCGYKGLPVIVTIMHDFQPETISVEEVMKLYADYFLQRWKFYSCLDGVIHVIGAHVSVKRVYRQYGPTARAFLGEKCISYIDESTASLYAEGKFTEAIQKEVKLYSDVMNKSGNCPAADKSWIVIPIVIIVVLIIVASIVAIFLIQKRRRQASLEGNPEGTAAKKPLQSKEVEMQPKNA